VQADVEQTAGIDVVADAGLMGPAVVNTSTGNYKMRAWYVEGSIIPFRWGAAEDRFLRLIFRWDDVDTNSKANFTPFDKYRITPGMELQFASNARLRLEWQYNTLRDYGKAPKPFRDAGGEKHITMLMWSLITWF